MSSFADQLGFGAGVLTATPAGGTAAVRFGVLQDAEPKFSTDIKPLHGQHRYAIALGAGKSKAMVSCKYAGLRLSLLNLYFGGTLTTGGRTSFVDSELVTIGSVSLAQGATFVADQGIVFADTGEALDGIDPLLTPGTGEYTVDPTTGTYTFSAADSGRDAYISYTYTTATGKKLSFGNPRMGLAPIFSTTIAMPFDGRLALWTFPVGIATKLGLATKLDDWTINDFEIEVAADITGNLGTIDTDQ